MKDDDGDEADERVEKAFAALDAMKDDLGALRDRLADMNSLFPATREFLKSKGASHVLELSPEDRQELMAYLKAERDALLGLKGPSN